MQTEDYLNMNGPNVTAILRVPDEILTTVCAVLFDDGCSTGESYQCPPKVRRSETLHTRYPYCDAEGRDSPIFSTLWGSKRNPKDSEHGMVGLYNFRLVCHRFAAVAACFTHRSVSFTLSDTDLTRLYHIASRPQLCYGVRSLKYYAASLVTRHKPPKEPLLYGTRARPMISRGSGLQATLACSEYPHLFGQHYDIQAHKRDAACFRDVFPRLPGLQSLELVGKPSFIETLDIVDVPALFYKEWISACITALMALETGAAKLSTLHIDALDWRFFCTDPDTLDRIASNLGELRRLRISLSAHAWGLLGHEVEMRGSYHFSRIYGQTLSELRTCMGTGVVKRFIEPFDELHSLMIELPIQKGGDLAQVNGRLRDVIPLGRTWAHLTKLGLRNLECDGEELLNLLLDHKDTLNQLCLGTVVLRSGSWDLLFDGIRGSLRLEAACICDDLWWTDRDGVLKSLRSKIAAEDGRGWGTEPSEILLQMGDFLCNRVVRKSARGGQNRENVQPLANVPRLVL